MMSTVIGGAMLPHAPQFFTMPETEDKKNVEHVRAVAAEIGNKLRALEPDLWIIFSNDHAEQFFHNAAPPFTVHVGGEATRGKAGGGRGHGLAGGAVNGQDARAVHAQEGQQIGPFVHHDDHLGYTNGGGLGGRGLDQFQGGGVVQLQGGTGRGHRG